MPFWTNGMRTEAIRLKRVSKHYGPVMALNGIDLRLCRGKFLLLAGSNGAGKSTLLRLLAGICKPTAGQVLIDGADPASTPATRANIGLLAHNFLLYNNLSARENLLFFARLYDLPNRPHRVDAALSETGLLERQDQKVNTFSRGMKQRLALARATIHQPSILLLDEPYTGLDSGAAAVLENQLSTFKKQGHTCVLVTHRADAAVHLMDHLVILHRGKLCQQGPWTGKTAEDLHSHFQEHLEDYP